MEEKTKTKQLREKLLYQTPAADKTLDGQKIATADLYAEGYKQFLATAKTEREHKLVEPFLCTIVFPRTEEAREIE